MAVLRVFQKIDNDVWTLTFVNDQTELSDTDKKLMQKYSFSLRSREIIKNVLVQGSFFPRKIFIIDYETSVKSLSLGLSPNKHRP